MQSTQVYTAALSLSEPLHTNIIAQLHTWLGPLKSRVSRMDVVFNPARNRIFLGEMEKIESREKQPLFQGNLDLETDSQRRHSVLTHLNGLCRKISCNRSVRLIRVWHGTTASVLSNVLEDGFAAIARLDDGTVGLGWLILLGALYDALFLCRMVRQRHIFFHKSCLCRTICQKACVPRHVL